MNPFKPTMEPSPLGSSFDDFLREEGIFEEVCAAAEKKIRDYQEVLEVFGKEAARRVMREENEEENDGVPV